MNCSDTRGRLNPYLDGELGMDENVQVLRHLEGCAGCASVFDGERLFFDELRRQASGPSAPMGLRDRIAGSLGKSRSARRPWPFTRALVPAAAAAVLLVMAMTIFTPQPVEADTLARRAAAWHDARPASMVTVSDVGDLESYYGSFGRKACLHEKSVKERMSYAYKSACVERKGPGGADTCWFVAACPATGCRMTHACFPVPPGLEKIWDGKRKVFQKAGRTVIMNHRNGMVCLFVFDNSSEADRFLANR